jgi:MoaA/NifB/PqqE/SkfB family radical SAM enzyme
VEDGEAFLLGRLVDERFGRQVSAPFALQIEFTSDCNLRCVMCPLTEGTTASSRTPGAQLRTDTWSDLLDHARRAGQVFVAGFGEPLLHARCLEMLTDLDAAGVRTSFVTNGLALTPEVARTLATLESLVHVNVSIDSPDPETYRRIRRGSVRRALWGLGNLMAVFPTDRVSVSAIAMAENLETLVDLPGVLHPLGVTHLEIQGVADYNEYSRLQHLVGVGRFEEVVAELRSTCEELGIVLNLALPQRTSLELDDPERATERFFGDVGSDASSSRQCVLPWELPYVDANGEVFTCCQAAATGAPAMGRLGPGGLQEVWEDVPFRRFRRSMVDGRTLPDVCRACTSVAIGPHPFARFWGTLIGQSSDPSTGDEVVVLRNDGAETWTPELGPRVGVTAPRDGRSPFEVDSWILPSRPAGQSLAAVAPGELAEFRIPLAPGVSADQPFQFVVDGVCWLPGTVFTVSRPGVAVGTG